MSTTYATLDDLKAAIAPDGAFDPADTTDDNFLQDCLDAAADWVDAFCGRTFVTAATGAREFYPDDTRQLDVIDLKAVASVEIDSHQDLTYATTVPAAEYELLPLDVGQPGVHGQAMRIRLLPTSSYGFLPGYRVRVTGSWGYDGVPAAVKLATIRLAQRAYKLIREAPFGVVANPDMGAFARISGEDPQVKAWLDPYRAAGSRSEAWVAV